MFSNIFTNQKEEKIYDAINEHVLQEGYRIVKVRASKSTIQILIDRLDEKRTTLGDCEVINKKISIILGIHKLAQYKQSNLEVSSPGINRPLTTMEDLEKNTGKKVKVKTLRQIEQQNNFKGKLIKLGFAFCMLLCFILP